MNLFKTKKVDKPVYPEKVILAQHVPFIGENLELTLNSETNEYEIFCKVPFTDQKGNYIEKMFRYAIPVEFYKFPSSLLFTPDQFKEYDFRKTKITELKELLNKLEKL